MDRSYLDKKYFIDPEVYNCPFCNRRNVKYSIKGHFRFNWNEKEKYFAIFVCCDDCNNISMHLSKWDILENGRYFKKGFDIDSSIFYSVPTSFFVMDSRIPRILRDLITEAEGCLKLNFLTGASACMRKAIYELTFKEKAEEKNYAEKIKSLKNKYPNIDAELFDILAQIQGMTSDKIHEQSWDKWDSKNLKLIIETLKTILQEIYVLPEEKKEKLSAIRKLNEEANKSKKNVPPNIAPASTPQEAINNGKG